MRNYSGYRLTDPRAALEVLTSQGFPPAFELVLEHVTYRYPDTVPAPPARVRVTGVATGDGVQALVVSVDSTTRRPDSKTFHVTYSLAPGHRPSESNALLETADVVLLDPFDVAVEPF